MNTCTLHLTANAHVSHPAERAIVHTRIQSSGESQDAVTADVLASTKHLISEIDKIRIIDAEGKVTPDSPVTYVNTTAISTWKSMVAIDEDVDNNAYIHARPSTSSKPKRAVFTSQSTMEIRFRDFSLLSHITSVFATVPHTEVHRVGWKILEETEERLKEQARKDALREAMKRANAYCEVAGMHNCRPAKIVDQGNTSTNGFRPQAPYTRSGDMELQPEHQSVSAEVEVEFNAQYQA